MIVALQDNPNDLLHVYSNIIRSFNTCKQYETCLFSDVLEIDENINLTGDIDKNTNTNIEHISESIYLRLISFHLEKTIYLYLII